MRITAADSGRTLTVAIGTRINVALTPDGGSYDPPTTFNSSVLREDDHRGGYPAVTTATADFTAVARGSAHVISQTDMACLHTTPRCLPPQRDFDITIKVN